ncbi:MAG TPA: hypothetical protein VN829_08715 [Dongiaceae bacterium]|nr:hypothetical protein [Dongiaceae bacterium]
MKQHIPCRMSHTGHPGIPWDQNQELPGYREPGSRVRVMGDDERDDTSSSAQAQMRLGAWSPLAMPSFFCTPGVTQCLWG